MLYLTHHARKMFIQRVMSGSSLSVNELVNTYWEKGQPWYDFNYVKDNTECRKFGSLVLVKRDRYIITIYTLYDRARQKLF